MHDLKSVLCPRWADDPACVGLTWTLSCVLRWADDPVCVGLTWTLSGVLAGRPGRGTCCTGSWGGAPCRRGDPPGPASGSAPSPPSPPPHPDGRASAPCTTQTPARPVNTVNQLFPFSIHKKCPFYLCNKSMQLEEGFAKLTDFQLCLRTVFNIFSWEIIVLVF